MASVRTDPVPAEQPEPGTARQACPDRPAVWAAGLAKSYGPTVALAGLDLHVAATISPIADEPTGALDTATGGGDRRAARVIEIVDGQVASDAVAGARR